MRRTIVLALIIAIIMTFTAACTQETAESANATGPKAYKDGVYTAAGEADAKGWTPEIELTINSGRITAVKYDESASVRKSDSPEYQKTFKENTKMDISSVYSILQNSLIKSQDAEQIDTVSGATSSTANFKTLAGEALKKAAEGEKYLDGFYTVSGEMDEKGWIPVLSLTIKDGKIEAVNYDEISSKVFKNKSKDTAYQMEYKKQQNIDLLTVYTALEKSLIEKQDPSKIDAYTGASYTYQNFASTAARALEQAIK